MILHLGGIVMRTDDSYTQKFTKQVVPPTRRYFHPLYRGTWFPTSLFTLMGILRCRFHPLYRGTWFPTRGKCSTMTTRKLFPSAISRYLVSNASEGLIRSSFKEKFPSAISRYLVSNPTSKTPPLTSGGGNGLHTPRRIDHIPTFASLNHDKNTRSTHYTPNAGIELSETTPPLLRVNPVQK